MENKKQKFAGFYVPNSTQVPDMLFDDLMADLSGAELKALLYIIRRTFGFKKQNDTISISQMLTGITKKNGEVLDRGTGLSKPALLKALRDLSEKNIILPTRKFDEKGGNMATDYRLNIQSQPPQQGGDDTPSKESLPRGLGKKNLQGLVKKVDEPLVKKVASQVTGLQDPVFKTVNVANKNKKIQTLPDITKQADKIEYLAEDIIDQLQDRHSLNFYKLIAKKIPESVIRQMLSEIKTDGARDPAKLFTYKIGKYTEEKLAEIRNKDFFQQKQELVHSLKNPFGSVSN